jgi:hypothetical protein
MNMLFPCLFLLKISCIVTIALLTGVASSEFYTKTASILNEKQPRIVIANSRFKKLHRRRLWHQTQSFPLAVITLGMIIRMPYYEEGE